MRGFLLGRIAQSVVVIFVIATLIFAMFRLLPGDPTALMVDQSLDDEARAKLLVQWGLDRPLIQQYGLYLLNALRGEFGVSFYYQGSVWDVLVPAWRNTVVLLGSSILLALAIGIVGGAYLGWRRGAAVEKVGVVIALALQSTPIFYIGILILMVFCYWLQLFPTGGMRSSGYLDTDNWWDEYLSLDFLHHLALPMLTATLYFIADPLMVMRTAMLSSRGEDYIEYLDSVGLPKGRQLRHAARNAVLPVVTFASVMVGLALGGQVILETIFAWPGIGREMVMSIERRDYPLAQAAFLTMAAIVVLANLAVDLVYSYLDPRISVDAARG